MGSFCSTFNDAREKACHLCDNDIYRKMNTFCEKTWYRVGVLIAIYAPAILVFFVVLFGGLGLGMFQAEFQNDIYFLWIEKGSRLLGERNFTEVHHSAGTVRQTLSIYSSPDYSSNIVLHDHLQFIFDHFPQVLSINATDEDLGIVGWHDVCDRIPTPLAVAGFMRATGGNGFPCNHYGILDCVAEGQLGTLGFDLPFAFTALTTQWVNIGPGCCTGLLNVIATNPLVDPAHNFSYTDISACQTACRNNPLCVAFQNTGHSCTYYTPQKQPAFNVAEVSTSSNSSVCGFDPIATKTTCWIKEAPFSDKYIFQQSFNNLTDNQYLQLTNNPRACVNWIGGSPPLSFTMGGPTVKNGVVQKLPSAQLIVSIKSFEQYAKAKCVNKCVVDNGCVSAMQLKLADLGSTTSTGLPGSCQAAIVASGAACVNNCSTQDAFTIPSTGKDNVTVGSKYNAAFFNYCFNPACPAAEVPYGCGGCVASTSSPTCAFCGQVVLGMVPEMSACVQYCATPIAAACIGQGLGAAAVCEANCTAFCQNPSDAEIAIATDVIMSWELSFINLMANLSQNKSNPFKIDYFTERSIDDLVNAAGAADEKLIVIGYFAMIVFGCVTLWNMDSLQSRSALGLTGMILVIFSIVAAMGFSAIVGIPYVPTIVQVLPFLALGLGTYDMFVMAFAFVYYPEKTIPAMIGELLKETGPRLMLTAVTNIIVFGIGVNIPLPAVNLFSGAMCIVIFFNFMILVFGFGALLALNAERMRRNKVDCCCCWDARYKSSAISVGRETAIGRCPLEFARIMFTPYMQVFTAVVSIVVFAVGMWGVGRVQLGLPLEDIVPADFYAYGYLKVSGLFYTSEESEIITGYRLGQTVLPHIDHSDPQVLADLLQLEKNLLTVPGTDPSIPYASTSWVDGFLFYCASTPGCARPLSPSLPQGVTFQALNPATGQFMTFNSSTTPFFPVKATWTQNLGNYLSSSGLNNGQYLELDNTGDIVSARIPFFQIGLDTDQAKVDYIKASRVVTDACPQLVYPSGTLYDFYEQYVHVRQYLGTNLGYTCIGVLLITWVFLFHPGSVLIMFAIICITIAEIFGFLSFFNLKLNGVSAVNMIMAIGVCVAPVAHITRVFMVSHGTNLARAEHALAMMTFPMAFSTISTFVGEFPMEFARFPYFTLYFFYQYVIIGIITIFNAFLPLPLLLAYFGPPPLAEESNNPEKQHGYERGGLVEIPGLEDSTAAGSTRTANTV